MVHLISQGERLNDIFSKIGREAKSGEGNASTVQVGSHTPRKTRKIGVANGGENPENPAHTSNPENQKNIMMKNKASI